MRDARCEKREKRVKRQEARAEMREARSERLEKKKQETRAKKQETRLTLPNAIGMTDTIASGFNRRKKEEKSGLFLAEKRLEV